MNFELFEDRIIEDLFDEEAVFEDRFLYRFPRGIPKMNPYNLAPWNIGWSPQHINREFCNRYYYPRRNSVHWPISRRNMRRVHTPASWLPLHIRAQNFGRYVASMQQRVDQSQEKTQYLKQLYNDLEESIQKKMQTFNGDHSEYVDLLIKEIQIFQQKYQQYEKH